MSVAAVLDAALAAALLVVGTVGVVAHALLGWVWVTLAVVFGALVFGWLRALRAVLAGTGRSLTDAPHRR